MLIHTSTWTDLMKKNCLIKIFYSSVKDGTTNDHGEKLDGHITDEDYLTCIICLANLE